jgi:hypothetical protein
MRGIEFKLTLGEFTAFDAKTGYVDRMGTGPDDLSIDRIDSDGAYEVGNIRAITFEDNIRKKLEKMVHPYDPIAKALQEKSGCEKNWRAFRQQAEECYDLVCRLQSYQEPEEEEPEEENPF